MAGSKGQDFDGQLPGEDVLLLFRKHPVTTRKGLIYGSACMMVGPLWTTLLSFNYDYQWFKMSEPPSFNFFLLSLFLSLVLGVVVYFPYWLTWYFSIYLLTNQRFVQIKQQGFFNKNVVDIGLDNISMINYEVKGVQETLLGFGTITMQTYVGELVIHEVHHPAKLQAELTSQLRKLGFMKQSQAPYLESSQNNE